jgi:hypothetical protein
MYLINLKVKKKLITKILGSGDFETILYENNHYVYAIGVLFENKYKHFILDVDKLNLSNIEDISLSLIKEFINYSININKNNIKFFIYFHNLRRFNGIFILKCFKKFYKKKNIKVLIRDNNIFKIQYNNLIFLDSLNIINNISKSFLNKEKEEIISFKGLLISKLNNIKFTYLKNK